MIVDRLIVDEVVVDELVGKVNLEINVARTSELTTERLKWES